MSGRRDPSPTEQPSDAAPAVPTLATDQDGTVTALFDGADDVFAHTDVSVGTTLAELASEGVLAVDTPERYQATLEQTREDNGSFRTAILREGDLEPITYQVHTELRESDTVRWSLSEVGLPADAAGVLNICQEATADIGKQGAVRNVFGALERWVNKLLGPTALDVRRVDTDSDNLIRISRRNATTPLDDRSVVSTTEAPYNDVWPAGGSTVVENPESGFDSVGIVAVGTDGIVAIGRVGATVSTADLNAIQTLAESAATTLQAVGYRSVVNEQRAELDRYETLVESIPHPVFSTDASGRLTFVNRAFEEAFGYDLADCRGMHITDFATEDSTEAVEAEIRSLLDPETENYGQVAGGVKADGRECELEASFGAVYHDDQFDGIVGVLRDVTERKRNDEISAVMNRALRHNLRTSINNIIGYAELTEQGRGDTEEYMSVIREEGRWLMKLGDTMRAVRRSINANGHDNVVMAVEDLLEPLAVQYRSQYPEVTIDTHYESEKTIQGGSTLQVALDNVLENAIVHNDTEERRIDITVSDVPNGWIAIDIQDNGQGIDSREVDLVMGETEITQLQHGTGIGLWLTRWIVEIFEGELDIDTNERGTCVTIRLQEED
jgi:PAS domain S-box-containing protein